MCAKGTRAGVAEGGDGDTEEDRGEDRWVAGGEKMRIETNFDACSGVRISSRCSRGNARP